MNENCKVISIPWIKIHTFSNSALVMKIFTNLKVSWMFHRENGVVFVFGLLHGWYQYWSCNQDIKNIVYVRFYSHRKKKTGVETK